MTIEQLLFETSRRFSLACDASIAGDRTECAVQTLANLACIAAADVLIRGKRSALARIADESRCLWGGEYHE